ncbi:hypothetical protein, partial [Streptomyces sp. GSL17-113]|uniref:hypothetical protein n=1 Tax=Streptomyces sp. GSL17-113 TaxID=3115365 RepID=UPI002E75AED1
EAAEAPASPPAIAYVLQPTAAEAALGITAEELGVRALPDTATPEQRAHAEAVWRPADSDKPCRCSGAECHHGEQCEEEGFLDPVTGDGNARCTGRMI